MSETAAPPTFGARLTGGLIAAAIVLAALYAVLSAYGPEPGQDNGGVHALSNSAVGFSGVLRLAQATGMKASVSRDDRLVPEGGLLVLTPAPGTSPAKIKALIDARREQSGPATVLVVLPKWLVSPLPRPRGWVQRIGLLPELAVPEVDARLKPLAAGRNGKACCLRGFDGGLSLPMPAQLRTLADSRPDPVLTAPGGGTIIAWLRGKDTYVLADPDLLNNLGMRDPASARGALALLAELANGGPVSFDVTLAGLGRSRNLARLAFEPPFLGLTICLLVAAALAGMQAAIRFGSPRGEVRAIAFGKRALVDNAAELIRSARREPAMTARYAAMMLETAATVRGAPVRLQGAELAAWLDRRRSGDGASFTELDEAAHTARSRDDSLGAARALHAWKEDVTHDG